MFGSNRYKKVKAKYGKSYSDKSRKKYYDELLKEEEKGASRYPGSKSYAKPSKPSSKSVANYTSDISESKKQSRNSKKKTECRGVAKRNDVASRDVKSNSSSNGGRKTPYEAIEMSIDLNKPPFAQCGWKAFSEGVLEEVSVA